MIKCANTPCKKEAKYGGYYCSTECEEEAKIGHQGFLNIQHALKLIGKANEIKYATGEEKMSTSNRLALFILVLLEFMLFAVVLFWAASL